MTRTIMLDLSVFLKIRLNLCTIFCLIGDCFDISIHLFCPLLFFFITVTLNECHGVSNNRPLNFWLNSLSRLTTKQSSQFWWISCTNCLPILRYTHPSHDIKNILTSLTHWGRVTHICVGKSNIIASDNGLSPGRRQAIIWINAGIC